MSAFGSRRGPALRSERSQRVAGPSWRRLTALPLAAWACAAVAVLNAACWSLLSPPFQVPDEPAHYAYVATLAETGNLPTSNHEEYAPAEEIALADLHFPSVFFRPANDTISTQAEQNLLEYNLARPFSRVGIAAGVAMDEPPLYYVLETIPYHLAASGTVLDRLALMRLLSAAMGGLTALFAFLFIREALPGAPWAWVVGGLCVALAPLLGMISGAVNPDAMLFAVSAMLFYSLARGFRRGLTARLAGAIGAICGIGIMTKLNFLGLLPGATLGLLILGAHTARTSRRAALGHVALALASATIIVIVSSILDGRSYFGAVPETITLTHERGSLLSESQYIWQFYLPRLPGMVSDFRGLLTTRVVWFDGLVGLYGWLDTTFPNWVYTASLAPAFVIVLLFARALFKYRRVLRARLSEVVVYLAMSSGVLVIVGASDYASGVPGEYREPRYLLPMVVLGGAALALAARGAGRRWGPAVGAVIVLLFAAHDIFSQLLVISRFYG
jgi:4-amino-4-deoxy-L-arabinose transferase-like glycosyltransferase